MMVGGHDGSRGHDGSGVLMMGAIGAEKKKPLGAFLVFRWLQ